MRLAHKTDDHALETGGVQAQGTFKIKAAGKAFRILIDGLYSDKFQSMVRELCSNAFDSHKKLGNPAPFYVHLPTVLRPEFYIRDYGVGMTHEMVMGTYSTLFDSDKDGDNDLVGMFGLGSKTPFSYTDQFCVTCYDGVSARHYGAGIGDGGVPQIILLQTEPSDEPLGVRVSVSVEAKDFARFKEAAEKVALGFDPMFECNIALGKKLGNVLFEGEGWACYGDSNLPSLWNVRQGCVIYPVETTGGLSLPADNSYSGQRKYLLEAPIGKIEVTTSREQVAYSKPVLDYLNERLAAVVKETGALIAKKIKPIRNVAKFFETISRIKPAFVTDQFVHTLTGLTSTHIAIPAPACVLSLSYEDIAHRWSYCTTHAMTAKLPNEGEKTFYEIADIAQILDPAREPKAEFNPREYRRVSRLLRAYCENAEITDATFWLGLGWSDEFVACTLPRVTRIKLTVDDLMKVIPKKRGKPVQMAIRGIALLNGDFKEQQPVTEIVDDGKSAWITADQYRRASTHIIKLCQEHKIENIYVASSISYDKMEESTIKRVKDVIGAKLEADHGVSWADYSTIPEIVGGWNGNLIYVVRFGATLLKEAPQEYDRLVKSKTMPGEALRHARRFLEAGVLPSKRENHKEAFNVLNSGSNGTKHKQKNSADMVRLKEFHKEFTGSSPSIKFLSSINNALGKAQLEVTTKAIIAVFRAIPSNLRWKETYVYE